MKYKELEELIYAHTISNQRGVKLIIMHPATWYALIEETYRNLGLMYINPHSPKPQYRGIEVYRTMDIPEGTLKVY